jgi:hypothetical protein
MACLLKDKSLDKKIPDFYLSSIFYRSVSLSNRITLFQNYENINIIVEDYRAINLQI